MSLSLRIRFILAVLQLQTSQSKFEKFNLWLIYDNDVNREDMKESSERMSECIQVDGFTIVIICNDISPNYI